MKNLNKTVHLHLQKLIEKHGSLTGKNIAVGFSGGADSTAILHIMAQKSKFFDFKLEAVFFSHEGSPIGSNEAQDKHRCEEYCKSLNIAFTAYTLDLEKGEQSWESAGRLARLSHYKNSSYDFVFLGHHRDDQNETTMTHLFRGAGKTVGGMKEFEGIYCRPLIEVDKKDIYEYLTKNNVPWTEDPLNQDNHFTRNFWRNEGLPTIAKHYPNYSNVLDGVRKKWNMQQELLMELAQVDGLDNLLSMKQVSVQSISRNRLQNLITCLFDNLGKSIEQPFLHECLDHYEKNKNTMIEIKDIKLVLNEGQIYFEKLENTSVKRKKIL